MLDRLTRDAVDLSRTSITNIEKGRQPVQLHQLVKFAESLGIQPVVLLSTNDSFLKPRDERLQHLHPEKRRWVERVISGDSTLEEVKNGGQIHSSTKKGNRSVRARGRK